MVLFIDQYQMNLSVRGQKINIPEYVIDLIPKIRSYRISLNDSNQYTGLEINDSNQYTSLEINDLKSKSPVIDEVSPKFLSLLIQGIKNDNKPSYMKKIFDDNFEERDIKKYLEFLQMYDLVNQYYPIVPEKPHKINGKILIDRILSYGQNDLKYLLNNNDMIRAYDSGYPFLDPNTKFFDIRNAMIGIQGSEVMIKNNHDRYIRCFQIGGKDDKDKYYLVAVDKLTEWDGKYWMNIEDYIVEFIDKRSFEHVYDIRKIYNGMISQGFTPMDFK